MLNPIFLYKFNALFFNTVKLKYFGLAQQTKNQTDEKYK